MKHCVPRWTGLLVGLVVGCSTREHVVREETRISVRAEGGEARRTATPVSVAMPVWPEVATAEELALGDDGTRCVRFADQSVWCWDESSRDRTPSRVAGIDPSVRLWGDAGAFCSMNAAGRVTCWGSVERETWREPRLLAVPQPVQMTFGSRGGCALDGDGSVRCWGLAWNGSMSRPLPSIEVQPALAGVVAIDAHGLSRCAVTRAHELLCWGWEAYGHLGPRREDGLHQHRETRGATNVALSREHVWWTTRDGRVRTMVRGRHDDRLARYLYDAVDVRGAEGVTAMASDGGSVCAITAAGAVWCWAPEDREARVQPITGARAIVANERDEMCVRGDAGWMCRRERGSAEWEPLSWGPRGEASTSQVSAAAPVCGYGPDRVAVEQLAAGYGHTCARLGDGRVRCWGLNQAGQVGGALSSDRVAPRLAGVPRPAVHVAAGQHFSCAITDDATLWCWGQSSHGQLGNGERVNSGTPVQVGVRGDVSAVALGDQHACALAAGQVWCWGANDRGQLGDGTTTLRTTPVRVQTLRASSVIAAGPDGSCAVDRGTVMCWGGASGAAPPHAIEGVDGSAVRALVVARGAACALTADGAVWCWGSGAEGQLGPAEPVESARAVRIEGIAPARSLAAYGTEICAAGTDGSAWCWGQPSARRAARRGAPPPAIPRHAEWIDRVVSIAPGYDQVCAAQDSGGVCCWGAEGQPRAMSW